MYFKYGEVSSKQIKQEKDYFQSAIFKLLPYKQEKYEYLDGYFESLLQRLGGFNTLSGNQPVVVTIMSLLEFARTENDFVKYRKAVLDACGLVQQIQDGDSYV
ncbi:MAG: hypothetical protein LUB59_03755 [Candidatus Gastranaerophilales bacterium]|nr:hypothetical protein [Candidatus Gastranaerophilales bacterium]